MTILFLPLLQVFPTCCLLLLAGGAEAFAFGVVAPQRRRCCCRRRHRPCCWSPVAGVPSRGAASPSTTAKSAIFGDGGSNTNDPAAAGGAAAYWLRASLSAVLTYVGFVLYCDRPRGGTSDIGLASTEIRKSTVDNAGLGLFATQNLPKSTVLGAYPGIVVPLQQHAANKLRQYPQCEGAFAFLFVCVSQ